MLIILYNQDRKGFSLFLSSICIFFFKSASISKNLDERGTLKVLSLIVTKKASCKATGNSQS